ncbi:MAG: N-acetylmuramoyl-L-alanine amidase [Candidatus Omnitrophota bacterium]|jgi:N-acetylmuramoyl-L-alanine amidase
MNDIIFAMRRLYFLLIILFFTACATTSGRYASTGYRQSDYVYIGDFCKKHNLQYDFDTLDDVVKIFSSGKDIRLILNSNVIYFNGSSSTLSGPPQYSNGRLFVPRDIEKIIFSKEPAFSKSIFTIKTVVIDPGHGGKDPGAISCRGMKEKDLNLKIAKYLKEELEERGLKVILTRDRDVYISLQGRVNVAKRNKADIFISIHGNSNRSKRFRGAEVYYLSPNRFNSQERALKLAKSEKFRLKKINPDIEAILWDLSLTKNYSLSVEMSHSLYFSFKNLGFSIRPPKKAPFYVLRLAYVPSVLVETGYLSNKYEEKWLRKASYQKQVAEAIALAIVSMNKQYNEFASKSE